MQVSIKIYSLIRIVAAFCFLIATTAHSSISNIVTISCPANLQDYIDKSPEGTTFKLPPCIFYGQTIHPKNWDVFLGNPYKQGGWTIFDGMDADSALSDDVTSVGVEFHNITIQNYGGWAQLWLGNNWQLTNSIIRNGVTANSTGYNFGIYLVGSGIYVAQNLIENNSNTGIFGLQGPNVPEAYTTVVGNEITHNCDLGLCTDPLFAFGGIKFGHYNNVLILNNNIHDNGGFGIWCDVNGRNWFIDGNKSIDNQLGGIVFETCLKGIISGNTVSSIYGDNKLAFFWPMGIEISASEDTSVIGNNVTVQGPNTGWGIVVQILHRIYETSQQRNYVIGNNVALLAQSRGRDGFKSSINGLVNLTNDVPSDTSFFDGNYYFIQDGDSTPHWLFQQPGEGGGLYIPKTWDDYRNTTGQDKNSDPPITIYNGQVKAR